MEEDIKPIRQQQRRLNPTLLEVVKKVVTKLLAAGIIYPISDSQWVSLVQVVPKKSGMTVMKNQQDGLVPTRIQNSWGVYIDYRRLNLATRKDHFPLPFIDQMLEKLARKSHYCFLDEFSGYMQIHIAPEDHHKTTFTCPFGTFAYTRMPFGLYNAPSTFQRCMMSIFSDLLQDYMEVFMDDFTVYADSFEACLSNLSKLLKSCIDTNLVLNFEKCHFMVTEGIVLGHLVSNRGIEVDKAKIDIITSLPNPASVREVRSFLGHAGFYRRFIKNFSKLALPLSKLLQKDVEFNFDQPCIEAFQELKSRLTSAPILQAPNWDLPFELMCDASNSALGVVLGQRARVGQPVHVIAYASRTMDPAQQNYTTTEKELLAIVFALDKFRSYLLGSKIMFTMKTKYHPKSNRPFDSQQHRRQPFRPGPNQGPYATQQFGSAPNTYQRQAGYQQPTQQYPAPPFQQQQQQQRVPTQGNSPSLEDLMKQLATNNLEFQQSVSSSNMQVGQLANTVSQLQSVGSSNLPSQTIPNPRGNASVVTLRSGKELPQPTLQQLPRSAEADSEPNADL
ncbi:Retrovirus-related Pol polyprotein from transposon 17.6, partial [Mucuna pruriens]